MKEVSILLVRHPETEANTTGRFVGRGDSPYTADGQRQLMRIPRRISAFTPDAVWSSPLQRAARLAEKSARAASAPLTFDDRLVELDFGDVEGLTYEEISDAGIEFNYRSREEPVAPGGESRGAIERRTVAFCDELVARGGRHVVVTHGGVFRAALVHLLALPFDAIWAFHVRNAQMAHVRIIDGHGLLEEYAQG